MAGTARWTYHISTGREQLAELGEQGWELVSVQLVHGVETFYYKRPFPTLSQEITLEQRAAALREKGEESR